MLATAIVLGVVVTGLGAWAFVSSATENAHTVTGTISVFDLDSYLSNDEGDSCSGQGGFDDIRAGTDVKIRDGEGSLVGSGSLGPGEMDDLASCVFAFEVTDVKDADFYEVEISHRGGLSYSKSEMEANEWTVGASLGD